ncbi:MAG TPA: hypothetical protein VN633_04155 [Bryobacteraceae bacterium]|nr:hypothetical protein [Bryobacteraceae bacterium]
MRSVFRPLCVLLSAILVAGLPIQAQESSSAASGEVQELHVRMVGDAAAAPTGKPSRHPLVLAVTDGNNAPVPSATVLVRLPNEGPTGAFNDGSRVAVLYTDMSGQVEINNIHWGSTPGTAVVRITASKGNAHAGLLVEQVIGSAQQPSSETASAAPKARHAASVQPGQPQTPSKKVSMQEPTLVASNTNSTTVSTPSEPPGIVINNHPDRQASSGASGRSKKWLWIGLGAAAAAGAAFAAVGHGSGSNPSTPASGTATIGTPSVSIGHP